MSNLCFNKNQWFFEETVPYERDTIRIGMRIKKKLYSGRSPYQKIEVFDTWEFGRILALDGILQTSEKDEFIYHEMLCQAPLFLHPNPKKVLIVGGGDGGSLEEILKHPVDMVCMTEIDEKVIEVSKKYLLSISKKAFEDKRVELVIADGKEYVKRSKNSFDVIILDLSDPAGPAKDLISSGFYKDVKRALKNGGIVSIQSGSLTFQPELVAAIFRRIGRIFPSVEVHRAVVPSYQAGEYSFTLASEMDLEKEARKSLKARYRKSSPIFEYYSPEIHFASKILPNYLAEKLK